MFLLQLFLSSFYLENFDTQIIPSKIRQWDTTCNKPIKVINEKKEVFILKVKFKNPNVVNIKIDMAENAVTDSDPTDKYQKIEFEDLRYINIVGTQIEAEIKNIITEKFKEINTLIDL